jgi:hypothetical protein
MRRVRDVQKSSRTHECQFGGKHATFLRDEGGGFDFSIKKGKGENKTKQARQTTSYDKKERTKGVSFGPQMRASQVKKSDSEIGPRYRSELEEGELMSARAMKSRCPWQN